MQVANPTCPERQKLILESLLRQDAVKADLSMGMGPESDLDSLIQALGHASIDTDDVSCLCTRKCATVNCPCKKSAKFCGLKCHPKNSKCNNR